MANTIGGFDIGFGSFPAAFGTIAMDGDEYVRCSRCGFGGCDVRVSGCGCTLHAVSFTYWSMDEEYSKRVLRGSNDPMLCATCLFHYVFL
jgi:hypothetical protein